MTDATTSGSWVLKKGLIASSSPTVLGNVGKDYALNAWQWAK